MQGLRRSNWGDLMALLVSVVAAAVAPLQVLILSYAFLGPFHYLTEIAWLRGKQFYFGKGLVSPRVYALLAIGMSILALVEGLAKRADFAFWIVGVLLFLSLTVWVRNPYLLVMIALAAVGVSFVLRTWVYFISTMVPTLVHVFFFTLAFMVSGALRDKRTTLLKWLNPGLLAAFPLLLLFLPMHYSAPSGFWLWAESASFAAIHAKLAGDLHHTLLLSSKLFNDPVVAGLLRLFAFIYLYHYLNWFAKTELLQWHKTSRRGWVGILTLYAASIAIYAWNFRIGLVVSTFLSVLHVLLEFPLNWHTLRFLALRWRGERAEVTTGSRTQLQVPL